MKKNVIMVVNPVSGGIDKSGFIAAASLVAAKENLNFILFETSGSDDKSNLKALYSKFNSERIIIAGGDGTVKMVAEALENEDVVFGILPAGSSNGLAVELNLIRTLEENITIAFYNHFIMMDIIEINGQKCLHLSDLGLNAKLIKYYEKSAVHGRWGYALQIVKTLLDRNHPFKSIITLNNQTFESESRMIVIANAQKYGTGVVINPYGIMDDGKFELIILKKLDLLVFGKIVLGRLSAESEFVDVYSTDKAIIKTEIPISFQIDGEFCGTETELDICMSPHKVKIAVP